MPEEIHNLSLIYTILDRPEFWGVYAHLADLFIPVFYNEPGLEEKMSLVSDYSRKFFSTNTVGTKKNIGFFLTVRIIATRQIVSKGDEKSIIGIFNKFVDDLKGCPVREYYI